VGPEGDPLAQDFDLLVGHDGAAEDAHDWPVHRRSKLPPQRGKAAGGANASIELPDAAEQRTFSVVQRAHDAKLGLPVVANPLEQLALGGPHLVELASPVLEVTDDLCVAATLALDGLLRALDLAQLAPVQRSLARVASDDHLHRQQPPGQAPATGGIEEQARQPPAAQLVERFQPHAQVCVAVLQPLLEGADAPVGLRDLVAVSLLIAPHVREVLLAAGDVHGDALELLQDRSLLVKDLVQRGGGRCGSCQSEQRRYRQARMQPGEVPAPSVAVSLAASRHR
jgi:hypothetical protein